MKIIIMLKFTQLLRPKLLAIYCYINYNDHQLVSHVHIIHSWKHFVLITLIIFSMTHGLNFLMVKEQPLDQQIFDIYVYKLRIHTYYSTPKPLNMVSVSYLYS